MLESGGSVDLHAYLDSDAHAGFAAQLLPYNAVSQQLYMCVSYSYSCADTLENQQDLHLLKEQQQVSGMRIVWALCIADAAERRLWQSERACLA